MTNWMSNAQKTNRHFIPFTEIEWKKVQAIYNSEDVEELKTAVEILNMWKCRGGDQTPLFIQISTDILRAMIFDKTPCLDENTSDVAEHIYCSVITRFVNYTNDCYANPERRMSIMDTLVQAGIPAWIVDLRHDAAHRKMPSIASMREALKFCRSWFWEKHWSLKFNQAIREAMPKEAYAEKCRRETVLIETQIFKVFKAYAVWRTSNRHVALNTENQNRRPFNFIRANMKKNPEEFVRVFVSLCLSKRWARDPRVRGQTVSYTKMYVPARVEEQNFYEPMIQLLKGKNLLPSLLQEITSQISNKESEMSARKSLSGWAEIMLKAFLQTAANREHADNIPGDAWRKIFEHIVFSPQFYTEQRIRNVMNYMKGKISEHRWNQLDRLLRVHAGQSVELNTSTTSTMSVYTLEDLKKKLSHNPNQTFVQDPMTEEGDWTIATEEELGPMGLTSEQTAESLNLDLDDFCEGR